VVALVAQVDGALVALQRLFALEGATASLASPRHLAKIVHTHVRLDEAAANEVGAAQCALEAPQSRKMRHAVPLQQLRRPTQLAAHLAHPANERAYAPFSKIPVLSLVSSSACTLTLLQNTF